MTTETSNAIKMLKNCREHDFKTRPPLFCKGISCSECVLATLCKQGKGWEERFDFLEKHYSKYLDNTFTEGETVLVSVNNYFFTEATFLYYSPKTKLYWVTENKREACAYEYCKPTEKPKKITMSEIEEKFGCKVEIVNDET